MNSNSLSAMSRREREVVDLLLKGKSNKQIALSLGISERTVEFHLNNVFRKFNVTSRVELILKLGKTTGADSANLVESTVEKVRRSFHNGKKPARSKTAVFLRNTVSRFKQEVAMNIRNSFEGFEDYLRSYPLIYSLLIFLTVSLSTRWVMFGLGLYHPASYFLLGVILGLGSIYFGLSWNKVANGGNRIRPLLGILLSALLPLGVGLFDQVYLLQTVLKHTEPISVSIAGISTEVMWQMSSEGRWFLYRTSQRISDNLWLDMSACMLLLFILSLAMTRRFRKGSMVAI